MQLGFKDNENWGIVCQRGPFHFLSSQHYVTVIHYLLQNNFHYGLQNTIPERYHFNLPFRKALSFGIYLSILELITYCPEYNDCVWERECYTFPRLSQLAHSGKIVLNTEMMCEVSFQIPREIVRCSPVKQRRECWEVVVESPSHALLFATPGTAAHQASLSLTIIWSLPKFMSIE